MAKFQSERQNIVQQDELGSHHDVDGMSLGALIALLQKLEKKHGADGRFNIEVESDYGYGSGYTSVNLSVRSMRGETPLEYAERHEAWQKAEKAKREQAKERKTLREAEERKQYERLQKKFGKKGTK